MPPFQCIRHVRRGPQPENRRFITNTLPFGNVSAWQRDIDPQDGGSVAEDDGPAVQQDHCSYRDQTKAEHRNDRFDKVNAGAELVEMRYGDAATIATDDQADRAIVAGDLQGDRGTRARIFES